MRSETISGKSQADHERVNAEIISTFDTQAFLPDLIEKVDWSVCRSILTYPFVRLVKNGQEIPTSDYVGWKKVSTQTALNTLDPEAVITAIKGGCSIVITHAQYLFSELDEFTTALSEQWQCHARANIYITPAHAQGLSMHRDDHSILVFQLAGCKQWVFGPTSKDGLKFPESDLCRLTLQPGQVLYVPKGAPHKASTIEESSVHISFGLSQTQYFPGGLQPGIPSNPPVPLMPEICGGDMRLPRGSLLEALFQQTSKQKQPNLQPCSEWHH